MAKLNEPTEMGSMFGRPDIERIGLFVEMPYLGAQTRPKKKTQREPGNMLCEGMKTRNGTQAGYFEDTFKRIFSKEALQGRGVKKEKPKVKNVSPLPFMPPTGFKLHSSPGDYYGTFSGVIEAFSNVRKPKPKFKPSARNFFSSPGKKGGPGYTDITIAPYPKHKPDRYGLKAKYKEYGKILAGPMVNIHFPKPFFNDNPFQEPKGKKPGPTYVRPKEVVKHKLPPGYLVPNGPAKKQGGCHAGCFEPFPEFKTNRDLRRKPKRVSENVFVPTPSMQKSFYNTSVLNQNVDFRLCQRNFDSFQPVYTKYLLAS